LPTQTSQEAAAPSACIADIRELCGEFQRAIVALSSDDLETLEAGIEVQDNLANKLQDWFHHQPSNRQISVTVNSSELRELINLTRVYSSLLTSCIRTARLRMALCRTYQQQFPASPVEAVVATSLSCEV
jgi:hypothetical protein